MVAYYNEFDPYPAQWLRNLIAAGHIPAGDVDERSITDVHPDDLRGYAQRHFFSGIGGWPLGLRLAGWPDDRPVWTGSCPCQPFSVAGKQAGKADARHLWPAWFRLIRESMPPIIFGEQVASAIAKGWLDDAFDDMESQGYACGAAVLPACSVGAPHKRDRLWFVAHAKGERAVRKTGAVFQENGRQEVTLPREFEQSGFIPHANVEGLEGRHGTILPERAGEQLTGEGDAYDAANAASGERREPQAGHGRKMPATGSEKLDWPDWSVESSICGLAHGIPRRMDKLRAYGNAIVPQVAAEFIKATM